MKSNQVLEKLFESAPTLRETAAGEACARRVCKEHPGGMGGSILGEYPRIMSKTTKAALWGGGENATLSLLKTDVIDRRYVDKDHFTMEDLIEGAFSQENRDLNDMPLAGMTRPPLRRPGQAGRPLQPRPLVRGVPLPLSEAGRPDHCEGSQHGGRSPARGPSPAERRDRDRPL